MRTVAITGVSSYFAGTVLPRLQADPEIDRIVGVDLKPPGSRHPKLDFHREDIRGLALREILRGADTVLHLAFIVEEIRDKKRTHAINVQGTENVFEAAARNGVRKIVYTSSTACYGARPHNPIGITEDFPRSANPDSYYSSDKAEVEEYLERFRARYPGTILTVFRPPVVVGPNWRNYAAEVFSRKVSLYVKGRAGEIQLLHEDDLGEALYLAIAKDLPGTFNLGPDDYSSLRKISRLSGSRLIDLPSGTLKFLVDFLYALRLEKMSRGWVTMMEYPIIVSNAKFKQAAGWQPRYGTEAALLDFLRSRLPR